jgi:hypothetical protein
MPQSLFSQTNPQGTHFSDGVRVGPIYPPSYSWGVPGGNFQTPVLNGVARGNANGVLLGPEVIYSITPYKAVTNALVPGGSTATFFLIENGTQKLGISAWLPLGINDSLNENANTDGNAIHLVNLAQSVPLGKTAPGYGDATAGNASIVNGSFTKGFVLDCARCLVMIFVVDNINGETTGEHGVNITVYGLDMYGAPTTSTFSLNIPPSESQEIIIHPNIYFPKSMKVALGVYVTIPSLNPTSSTDGQSLTIALQVGTTDIFGLPYRVDNPSRIIPIWGPDPGGKEPANEDLVAQFNIMNAGSSGAAPYATSTGAIICFNNTLLTADPAPYGLGGITDGGNITDNPYYNPTANLNPTATAVGGDPRGLIILPGYGYAGSSNFDIKSISTYTGIQNYDQADSLTVRIYVPGAMVTKPGAWPNPAAGDEDLPPGTVPGSQMYVQPWQGAGNNSDCVAYQVPTEIEDLYGSPQFWYD